MSAACREMRSSHFAGSPFFKKKVKGEKKRTAFTGLRAALFHVNSATERIVLQVFRVKENIYVRFIQVFRP